MLVIECKIQIRKKLFTRVLFYYKIRSYAEFNKYMYLGLQEYVGVNI